MSTVLLEPAAGQVTGTHTDFPVLIVPSAHTNIGALTLAEAQSVRIYTDSAKTVEIAREVVSADEIHAKVPSLSTSTTLYFDWDGVRADYAAGDTYGAQNVWVGYNAVYHLEEVANTTADGYKDSTSNSNHGTGVSMVAGDEALGKLPGNGQEFNGSTKFINLPANTLDVPTTTSPFTIQAWINVDPADQNAPIVSGRGAVSGSPIVGLFLGFNGVATAGTGFLTTIVRADNNSGLNSFADDTDISDGTWHMVHTTRTSAKLRSLYLNGAFQASSTDAMTAGITTGKNTIGAEKFWIDANFTVAERRYLDGIVDEVRISSVDRSADWITTEYNNHNSNATFWDDSAVSSYRFVPQIKPFAGL